MQFMSFQAGWKGEGRRGEGKGRKEVDVDERWEVIEGQANWVVTPWDVDIPRNVT